jgi:hypothetical protein
MVMYSKKVKIRLRFKIIKQLKDFFKSFFIEGNQNFKKSQN